MTDAAALCNFLINQLVENLTGYVIGLIGNTFVMLS